LMQVTLFRSPKVRPVMLMDVNKAGAAGNSFVWSLFTAT